MQRQYEYEAAAVCDGLGWSCRLYVDCKVYPIQRGLVVDAQCGNSGTLRRGIFNSIFFVLANYVCSSDSIFLSKFGTISSQPQQPKKLFDYKDKNDLITPN